MSTRSAKKATRTSISREIRLAAPPQSPAYPAQACACFSTAISAASIQVLHAFKSHYAYPLRIEELAANAQMSASSFHHHFRLLAAMRR